MIEEYSKRSFIGQFISPYKDGVKLVIYLFLIFAFSCFSYFVFYDFVMGILLRQTAQETKLCGSGRQKCLAPFRKHSPLIYVSLQLYHLDIVTLFNSNLRLRLINIPGLSTAQTRYLCCQEEYGNDDKSHHVLPV